MLEDRDIYEIIQYKAISAEKLDGLVAGLPAEEQQQVKDRIDTIGAASSQGALASMTVFPIIMLIGYILLIVYFQSQGGYKPLDLASDEPTKGEPVKDSTGAQEPVPS